MGGRGIRNILLISHCDFTGNSAWHAHQIAAGLHARGYAPVIAVPDDAETVEDVGRPPFPVITYEQAQVGRLGFPDGRGPDLVHAFTPRERVRKQTARTVAAFGCPYIVHLEDNDRAILSAELGRSIEDLEQLPVPLLDRIISAGQTHPLRGPHFVDHASGVSVVIDRLLELAPSHLPAAVVRPGFDDAVLSPSPPRGVVRAELGLHPDDCAVVYTGTIHRANLDDMRSLYSALAALRRDGHPIVFVKTGWNAPDAPELEQLRDSIRNLGWVPRASLSGLLAAADILVQPGSPGPFNDYRFPAKVPDFLASGKPVVLARTNIGLALEDGREAVVVENGTAAEIYRAIALLRAKPELAREIGERGRAFAMRELRWTTSIDGVETLYRELAATETRSAPRRVALDPPVKVVSLLSRPPSPSDARVARSQGVYGFCFPPDEWVRKETSDFSFCFRIGPSGEETIEAALSHLLDPAYITVSGAPLLLFDDPNAAGRWRSRAEQEVGRHVHFALVQRGVDGSSNVHRFDSLVELPVAPTAVDCSDFAMGRHLAVALPQHPWFRSVAFPEERASRRVYRTWLRKLVLQTMGRASAHEPLIFIDPGSAWNRRRARTAFLGATRKALRDGIQQLYASRQLDVKARRIEDVLRLE